MRFVKAKNVMIDFEKVLFISTQSNEIIVHFSVEEKLRMELHNEELCKDYFEILCEEVQKGNGKNV